MFDPFGGTGTTPLTASRLGKKAYYTEINPVLQFLTASKVIALQLRDRDRAGLADELIALADTLDDRIDASRQDSQLRQTYGEAFGGSEFFESDVFAEVLRSRTLIDDIGCAAPLTARFLTIAVLRALIPASRLIRRGDLRFKTEREQARGRIELRDEVREALAAMARDIKDLSPIDQAPILLLENAKNLDRVPALSIDAVITSPPYLNGTNYFRNTKVELWFLRCLKEREDLARFRFGSMTVGINDVTVSKPIGEMPPSAAPIVKALEADAYDVRIPRMVACFASENARHSPCAGWAYPKERYDCHRYRRFCICRRACPDGPVYCRVAGRRRVRTERRARVASAILAQPDETDAEAACIQFETREALDDPARGEAVKRLVVSLVRFQGPFTTSTGQVCKT